MAGSLTGDIACVDCTDDAETKVSSDEAELWDTRRDSGARSEGR
jgi:hypothetical protein